MCSKSGVICVHNPGVQLVDGAVRTDLYVSSCIRPLQEMFRSIMLSQSLERRAEICWPLCFEMSSSSLCYDLILYTKHCCPFAVCTLGDKRACRTLFPRRCIVVSTPARRSNPCLQREVYSRLWFQPPSCFFFLFFLPCE